MTDNIIRLAPSRNFMIRQAVLNTLNEHYPWGLGRYGAAELLRRMEKAGLLGLFTGEVLRHYRLLTDIYDEVAEKCGPAQAAGFWS